MVYESSKYPGVYYVIDPVSQQPLWVTGDLSLPSGPFLNPVTQTQCKIERVVYASSGHS